MKIRFNTSSTEWVTRLIVFQLLFVGTIDLCHSQHGIEIWYGDSQYFGYPGRAQRWVNILGNAENFQKGERLSYSLDGVTYRELAVGSDLHRLAEVGDFNVELSWDDLNEGDNTLEIQRKGSSGNQQTKKINLKIEKPTMWPLPYRVDFANTKMEELQKRVQIVDGKWELTGDGLRTVVPYYDRVVSIGDSTWKNFEATALVTVHDFTPPEKGPPTYDVTHFGMALRWRGHYEDGLQPSRQWYPLGSQGEFLFLEDQKTAKWRILFDGGRNAPKPTFSQKENSFELTKKMYIKGQVVTLENGDTRYKYKQWMEGETEPSGWDVEGIENGDRDFSSGALCLVPHNSDVTLHWVIAEPLGNLMGEWYARPGPGNIHSLHLLERFSVLMDKGLK